jgi:tRNA threonylcarbamoyladenosine biosynthesis protein TsaB
MLIEVMPIRTPNPALPEQTAQLLLAIDTCGPTGSVALGRVSGQAEQAEQAEKANQSEQTEQAEQAEQAVEILGQIELEGRSYSSTLVAAVGELLAQAGTQLGLLHAMVAVNGPGSFTGVRVGLAAIKGFAEAARIPVVAVSRLEVLAAKANVPWAALDAHRQEVYLRLGEPETAASGSEPAREVLAGVHELAAIAPPPLRIAVGDEAAAQIVSTAWPGAELVRTPAPTAADALRLCAPRVIARKFVDLALLDGHYLRRSDAEIFGEPAVAEPQRP